MYYCRWNVIEKHYKTPQRNIVKEKEEFLKLINWEKKRKEIEKDKKSSRVHYFVGAIMFLLIALLGYWIWS